MCDAIEYSTPVPLHNISSCILRILSQYLPETIEESEYLTEWIFILRAICIPVLFLFKCPWPENII
jgi:hypothetical protein